MRVSGGAARATAAVAFVGIAGLSAAAWADERFRAPMLDAGKLVELSFGQLFTYLFVMLGPLQVVGPYSQLTAAAPPEEKRKIAWLAFAVAGATGLFATFFGRFVLASWRVTQPALLLATGVVLLLVALHKLLRQYDPLEEAPPKTTPPKIGIAFSPLAFPTIITPYGIAGLILALAASPSVREDVLIVVAFAAIMLLDLLGMFFAQPILKYGGPALRVIGSVLGVLQVALSFQILLKGAAVLGLLPSQR
jgi:multiple antibiotic resistance protein